MLNERSRGNNNSYLKSTVALLGQTSKLVSFFCDARPVSSTEDDRLQRNQDILSWFLEWESQIKSSDVKPTDKNKMLMSQETRDDIVCLLRGFHQLVQHRLTVSKSSIVAAGINSDVVGNMFSQQRATHHGANTNPSVCQYKYGVNASILGAGTVSKKSASFSKKGAQPFNFSVSKLLNSRRPFQQ